MLLPDHEIKKLAKAGMISPFIDHLVSFEDRYNDGELTGVLSYGLGSYGYDVRVGQQFEVFSNVRGRLSDPKDLDPKLLERVDTWETDGVCIIPPNSFALAASVEYMKMPPNVTAISTCKSTYIRAGLVIPTTVIEAGWEGTITLELVNVTPVPLKVYAGEGIFQLLFFEGKSLPEITYADRKGKYQMQKGITLPRV